MFFEIREIVLKSSYDAAVGVALGFGQVKRSHDVPATRQKRFFAVAKRAMDLAFVILVLPAVMVLTAMLFVANKRFNPGPVFFRQVRMGQHGRPFTMWKFRTMTPTNDNLRAADAPLEEDRIPPLGRLLRRTKLDELPNIFNVFTGEMSLVGPRPDAFSHAAQYAKDVPHYAKRFAARPGITGLAQVRGGYADCPRAVQRKAHYDCFYVRKSNLAFDLKIVLATAMVMITGVGQR